MITFEQFKKQVVEVHKNIVPEKYNFKQEYEAMIKVCKYFGINANSYKEIYEQFAPRLAVIEKLVEMLDSGELKIQVIELAPETDPSKMN